jgi:hypothetical protein
MDLNTVKVIARSRSRDEIKLFAEGDAYLAGGTWLFSEPQRRAELGPLKLMTAVTRRCGGDIDP